MFRNLTVGSVLKHCEVVARYLLIFFCSFLTVCHVWIQREVNAAFWVFSDVGLSWVHLPCLTQVLSVLTGVGGLSVYVLLLLMNKKSALTYSKAEPS